MGNRQTQETLLHQVVKYMSITFYLVKLIQLKNKIYFITIMFTLVQKTSFFEFKHVFTLKCQRNQKKRKNEKKQFLSNFKIR